MRDALFASGKSRAWIEWDDKKRDVSKVVLPFQAIETVNEPRKKTMDSFIPRVPLEDSYNLLIWGDNKLIMSSLIPRFEGKIDLIYIDPPFATGTDRTFDIKVEGAEFTKRPSAIEVKAYYDTWGKGLASYVDMLFQRLILMWQLLSDRGTIYVHLNWRVGHYVKVMMDEIFGERNFRNEIIWDRSQIEIAQRNLTKVHDVILRYTKSDEYIWNPPRVPYSESLLKTLKKDQKGYYYTRGSKHRKMAQWEIETGAGLKSYVDPEKGKLAEDIWNDVGSYNLGKEKTGFPTQKPEILLKRIIESSSEPQSLVADFFGGSGTTVVVAEKLGRRWVGCDLSKFAIHITRKRLLDIPGARPFQILNLGMYQKQKLMENGNGGARYFEFIRELYGATPVQGFVHIHGRKGNRLVHIGPLDSFVSEREIRATAREVLNSGAKGIDILGWDFEMGLHDLLDSIIKEYNLDIKLKQIPLEVLELKAHEQDKRLDEIKFFDLNYLDLAQHSEGRKFTVAIRKFNIANPEFVPEDVRSSIKNFASYIDFWAVDFDYKGDTFHNMRQQYRTEEDPELNLKISHEYEEPGTHVVLVKVVDIFGNDTNKLVPSVKVS
jgi:adenine-specific DNA-methyltransferase